MNWSNPIQLFLNNLKTIKNFEIVQIVPNLYQSSQITKEGMKKIKELGVSVVVDLEGGFDKYAEDVGLYIRWPIFDVPHLPDTIRLKNLSKYIAQESAYKRILVHCSMGNNRSGLVNGCVLIWCGYNGREAVKIIQKARPTALSNKMFREWLESQRYMFRS